MVVTLEEFVGLSCGNGRPVKFDQYRIRVDGVTAGYIGYQKGAKPMLIKKFGPIEITEIENQVANLMKRDPVPATQAPNVPPELLKTQDEEDLDDIDLD